MADVLRNWTYDETISKAQTFKVQYVRNDVEQFEIVTHTPVSTSRTTYKTLFYVDAEGKRQSEDVVSLRETTTTTCVGAANPTRWRSKLENGSPARAADQLIRRSMTTYSYVPTSTGMRTVQEVVEEYEPRIAFAAGLGIQNYVGIDLGLQSQLVSRTITGYEWDEQADRTKVTVNRWVAWGATTEGGQHATAFVKQIELFSDSMRIAGTYALVDAMLALVFDGLEVRLTTGRGTVQSRPNPQDQTRDELNKEPAEVDGGAAREERRYNWPMRKDPVKKKRIRLRDRATTPQPNDPNDPNDPFALTPLSNKKRTFTLPFPTDDSLIVKIANNPGISDGIGDEVEAEP